MQYGLVDVCKTMLDNADMSLDLSGYPSIIFNFVVYGSVDDKFWEVIFQCDEVISLKIENDNDLLRSDSHLVLDVNVIGKLIENISKDLLEKISEPLPAEVWLINICGDIQIELNCCKFNWKLNELTKQIKIPNKNQNLRLRLGRGKPRPFGGR